MEKQLKEILNSLYEAEALLEMALRRPDGKRESIVSLAREKCFQVADKAYSLKVSGAAASVADSEAADGVPPSAPDVKTSPEPEEKDASELLFEEKIAPALAGAASACEPESKREAQTAAAAEDTVMLAAASAQEEAAEELTSEAYAEVCAEEEPAPDTEIHPSMSPGAEIKKAGETARDEAPLVEAEAVLDDPDYSDEADEETDDREEERRSMRIISRKPIASFFSINDKFRFRRELFSNSNPEWLNALALLETMADLSEAEDYLFDDLQWDRESPDVEAFVQVLTRYYNS